MPHVVNGIGTWYYGKDNIYTNEDECGHCGHRGLLKSYDTRKYFVLIMIPIIPLNRLRILDECPTCRNHRCVQLDEWNKLKAEAVEAASGEYQNNPDDAGNAKELIAVYVQFQEREKFLGIAPSLLEQHAQNDEVTFLVGVACAMWNHYEEAERAYRAAIAVKPETKYQDCLIEALINLKRLEEADELAQEIIDGQDEERAYLLISLAEAYRAAGDNGRSMEILESARVIVPELDDDKSFRKMHKTVGKQLAKSPAMSAMAVPKLPPSTTPKPLWARPGVILAALIAVVGMYMGASLWIRMNRAVFLVNGLPTVYSVKIDGKVHEIGPFQHSRITVSEGTMKISCMDKELSIPDQEVKLETNMFTRLFVWPTFVLNPDRTAILAKETVYYGNNPASLPKPKVSYFLGEPLYAIPGIDHPFGSFPQQISIDSNSDVETRSRLSVVPNPRERAFFLIMGIGQNVGKEKAISVAKQYARSTPDASLLINYMSRILAPEDMLELLEEGLDKKPVRVEWHRTYQHLKTRTAPNYDIEAEYLERVKKSNNDPALVYLLGRVSSSSELQRSRFKQAALGSPPNAYALNALAYDALEDGRFADAVAYSTKARKAASGNIGFDVVYCKSLMAAGRYAEAEKFLAGKVRGKDILAETWQPRYLQLCAMQKNRAKADNLIASLGKLWKEKLGDAYAKERTEAMKTAACYLFGDYKSYISRLRNSKDPRRRFQRAVTSGDAKTAAAELKKMPTIEIAQYMELYLLEQITNNGKVTEKTHSALLKKLNNSDFRHRRLAEILSLTRPVTIADLDNVSLGIDARPVVLAILGIKWAENRSKLFEAARKVNIFPSYPYQLVDRALKK